MTVSTPSKMPMQESGTSGSSEMLQSQSSPTELSATEIAMMMTTGTVTAPTLEPPKALAAEKTIAAWLNDKRISALWAINENRNSWVHIGGVGWKKLANNSDSAIVALTYLASHAKQLNCRVDYREEADGMIREIYVW